MTRRSSPWPPRFSLTDVLTITLAPGATLTGSNGASLVHAPEPGTLATAGIGLAALALAGRCRRRTRRDAGRATPVAA